MTYNCLHMPQGGAVLVVTHCLSSQVYQSSRDFKERRKGGEEKEKKQGGGNNVPGGELSVATATAVIRLCPSATARAIAQRSAQMPTG